MQRIIKIKDYSYKRLKNDLLFLNYEYPNFKINHIGKSTLGEKIIYFKLGDGKRKLLINASHHANEWMTSLILMLFIEKYLMLYQKNENYKGYSIRDLWKRTSLYVVPMVNPDGVNLCLNEIHTDQYKEIWGAYRNKFKNWKANIRGVDLNLNYPAGWEQAVKNKKEKGYDKPGPRDYPGANAISEIEVKNMISFSRLFQFDMTISLHSQGREIYWTYLDKKIEKAFEIGKKFERVSGYTLTKPNYYSSFAGYKDWYINEFEKPSFTIEIGKGEESTSLPLEKAEEIYEEVEEIFFQALENC